MPFWLLIAVVVASFVLQRLMMPKIKGPDAEDVTIPTAEAGSPIPVHFGVAELAPNTVAFGGVQKRKAGQYWRYSAWVHHVFCWGVVNEVVDMSMDGLSFRNWQPKHPVWGESDNPTHHVMSVPIPLAPGGSIMNPGDGSHFTTDIQGDDGAASEKTASFFGGNSQQGGIGGDIRINWGYDGQTVDQFLAQASVYGPDRVSAWPRVCHMRMGGGPFGAEVVGPRPFYLGANTPTPAPFRAILRRTAWWETPLSPLGQSALEATLRYDASMPEIVYALLTDPVYGTGRAAARIDLESFQQCAATLRTEVITPTKTGFGISCVVASVKEIGTVIRECCNTVDASLATSPVTGKLRMKLLRGDYVVDDLVRVTKANSKNFKYAPSASSETVNEVRLTYRRFVDTVERRGFVEDACSSQDLANATAVGRVRTATVNYPMITDPDIAQLVCDRERTMRGVGLAKCSWVGNREFSHLMQGDVVVADQEAFGVANLVLRIVKINYGTLVKGEITIDAVQDVFSVAQAAYSAPIESSYQEPVPEIIF